MNRKSLVLVVVLLLALGLIGCSTEDELTASSNTLILFEDLEGLTNVNEFWTAAYKSLPGEETKPMYFWLEQGTITLEDNGLKLAEGARFTIGTDRNTNATKNDKDKDEPNKNPGGFLDLSRPFKITFVLVDSAPGNKGNFQVYLDNNSTSSKESIHGSESRICEESLAVDGKLAGIIANDGIFEVGPIDFGTETSFLQVRANSGSMVVIKSIKIEYVE